MKPRKQTLGWWSECQIKVTAFDLARMRSAFLRWDGCVPGQGRYIAGSPSLLLGNQRNRWRKKSGSVKTLIGITHIPERNTGLYGGGLNTNSTFCDVYMIRTTSIHIWSVFAVPDPNLYRSWSIIAGRPYGPSLLETFCSPGPLGTSRQ